MIDAPVLRVVLLRCFGLATGLALALVAIGLVAYGVDRPPVWLTNGLASFARWVSLGTVPGVAVLAGAGLVGLVVVTGLVMLPHRPAGLHRLERSQAGTTWVDISSVARTLERSLRDEVDGTIGVRARKDRLEIVSPARPEAPFAIADLVGEAADRELGALGLSNVEYGLALGSERQRQQPRVQ